MDKTFTIYLNDDNDRPRDLSLTNDTISENATAGTVIGSFTARDEDIGQKLSFSLVNDDGRRFALNGDKLVTAKSLDHEADKRHVITVAVVDNGFNALKVRFLYNDAREQYFGWIFKKFKKPMTFCLGSDINQIDVLQAFSL